VALNPGRRSGRSGLKGFGLKPYWGKLTQPFGVVRMNLLSCRQIRSY
jgi:hypothetical protein